MSIVLTPELEQLLQTEVASGRYPSIDAAICVAVRDIRDRDAARESLKRKIAAAEAEILAGHGIELADDEDIDRFFDVIA